jgi:glycolate oxidase FAD binding subunit
MSALPDSAVARVAEQIRGAAQARTPLRLRGGGSKDFYGNACAGELLDLRELRGIVSYEPSELVVTARAGTALQELEAELAQRGQMLAFEPPHFAEGTTVGGCIAAGLAGPRRCSYGTSHGAVRDFVLGAHLLDGRGQLLQFGGTVMKNVAGFDVARVLAGSLGTLGAITELSIKVLPRPALETSLRFALDEAGALQRLVDWGRLPLPVSASAWHAGTLMLRLSGAPAAVEAACAQLGGERIDAPDWWKQLRDHALPFFADGPAPEALWRIALPTGAGALQLEGSSLIEWGGALRWLRSALPATNIRARAQALGGHATLFRGGDRAAGAFTPLAPAVAAIHRRLKAVFDPAGIMNPGRMYADI